MKKPEIKSKKNISNKEEVDEEWVESDESKEFIEDPNIAKKREVYRKLKTYKLRLHKAQVNNIGELLLPNGKLLGHREYKKFYKIHFRLMNNNQTRMKVILGDVAYNDK